VDVVVSASGPHHTTAGVAEGRKTAKYGAVLQTGTASRLIPFVVGPFGTLAKAAQEILKQAAEAGEEEGGTSASRARLPYFRELISVAAVRGTALLTSTWGANQAYLLRPPQSG